MSIAYPNGRRSFLGAVAGAVAAVGSGTITSAGTQLPVEGELPSLDGAMEWIHSEPLAPSALQGKVVLVDFWTYTCINWLRTAPYIRAWDEKYRRHGLVVLGVHTPEFAFERDATNVHRAVSERGIKYPVAIDNGYAIWRAFRNQYWPALYLADAKGRIRHHHFGEGGYEQSERAIQQLLTEARSRDFDTGLVTAQGSGIEAAADWRSLQSPENYLGSDRTQGFASPGGSHPGKRRIYAPSPRLSLNEWSLTGEWTIEKQAVIAQTPNGRITLRFRARDLHLVMAPAAPGARFRVSIDGRPPEDAHGIDIDGQGNGVLTEPRLYQLIRQQGPVLSRTFEIEFLDAGASAFAFTFG